MPRARCTSTSEIPIERGTLCRIRRVTSLRWLQAREIQECDLEFSVTCLESSVGTQPLGWPVGDQLRLHRYLSFCGQRFRGWLHCSHRQIRKPTAFSLP